MNRILVRTYEFVLVFAFVCFGFAGYYYLTVLPELAPLGAWQANVVGVGGGLLAGVIVLGPLAALIEISNDIHSLLLEARKSRGSAL